MKGYIYILINPSYQGFIKIGHTKRLPEIRGKEYKNKHSMAGEWIVQKEFYIEHPAKIETIFKRQNKNRIVSFLHIPVTEVFHMSADEASEKLNIILQNPEKFIATEPEPKPKRGAMEEFKRFELNEKNKINFHHAISLPPEERTCIRLLDKISNIQIIIIMSSGEPTGYIKRHILFHARRSPSADLEYFYEQYRQLNSEIARIFIELVGLGSEIELP